MPRRHYSEADKAALLLALDGNGGNLLRTARQTGIPLTTVADWAKNRGIHPAVTEVRNEQREPLADRLEALAHLMIDAMPDKMAEATMQQLALSFAISVDKMRLLREQATAINQHDVNLSDDERAEGVAALLERARARRDGQPSRDIATVN